MVPALATFLFSLLNRFVVFVGGATCRVISLWFVPARDAHNKSNHDKFLNHFRKFVVSQAGFVFSSADTVVLAELMEPECL